MDGNTKAWARSKHKQSERQNRRHGKGGRGRGRGGSAVGSVVTQHPPDIVDGSSDEGSEGDEEESSQLATVATTSGVQSSAPTLEQQQAKGRSKYSRRQIRSNHGRYKENEDSEEKEESYRGADMRELLSQATSTGAGAHMRLRGEGDLDASSAQVFELDCAKLAAALRTLPIALRLNLSTENAPYRTELLAIDGAAGVKPVEAEEQLEAPLVHSQTLPVSTLLAAPTMSQSPPPTSPLPVSLPAPVLPLASRAPQPTKKEAQDIAELDALLASSKPVVTTVTPTPVPSAAKPVASPKTDSQSKEDLEQWLDSVI